VGQEAEVHGSLQYFKPNDKVDSTLRCTIITSDPVNDYVPTTNIHLSSQVLIYNRTS
jgi:hypothetical protein